MALDRQSIERKDFPVGPRGYDPEAVDAHLSSVADEIADLKRSARLRTDTLASSASEQVRAIGEAAESSAADIQNDAENVARDIRDEANSEAQATREHALEQARDYVGKLSESTSTMLKRLDAMENELGELVESLRTGSNRLNTDLQLLESSLKAVAGVVAPRPRFEAESESVAEPGPSAEPVAEQEIGSEAEPVGDELPSESEPETEVSAAPPAPPAVADGADDSDGARLIALNMALNGAPREETARYLSENFHLRDAGGLLNEVYASVEG